MVLNTIEFLLVIDITVDVYHHYFTLIILGMYKFEVTAS